MNSNIKVITFIALMGCVATASSASYFDGKTPLLCSVHQLFECDPPNACKSVTPEQIQGVSHLDIDFKKKTVTRASGESTQKSDIESIETGIDGKLIIRASRTARRKCVMVQDGPSPSWIRRAPWCWRLPVMASRWSAC